MPWWGWVLSIVLGVMLSPIGWCILIACGFHNRIHWGAAR